MFSSISKALLWFLGWQPLKIDKIPEQSILIYSHTTYWDFFFFLLYKLAYPDKFQHLWTLVKPQPFRYAGWILRYLKCLPATPREETGGGAISRIVEHLKDKEKFCFILSPKGSIIKREWRSGYRVLARELDCPIWLGGLDYVSKSINLSPYFCTSETSEIDMKDYLAKIIPLHPENSEFPIRRAYNPPDIGICNWLTVTTLISSILIIPSFFHLGWPLGIWSILTAFIAFKYHQNYEQRYEVADRWLVRVTGAVYFRYFWECNLQISVPQLILMGLTLYAYHRGLGRGKNYFRSFDYVIWHSVFHITFALMAIWPIWF